MGKVLGNERRVHGQRIEVLLEVLVLLRKGQLSLLAQQQI